MSLYGYFCLKPKPEHIEVVEQSLKNCEFLTVHEIQKKTGLTITQAKCAISYMVETEQLVLGSNSSALHCYSFKLPD